VLRYNCELDSSGAVGRRYRRADEIGVPLCITVDFETLEDGCVTVRDRDSMQQRRVAIADLDAVMYQEIELSDA
jgi:glycyl-tRNA synthetase